MYKTLLKEDLYKYIKDQLKEETEVYARRLLRDENLIIERHEAMRKFGGLDYWYCSELSTEELAKLIFDVSISVMRTLLAIELREKQKENKDE